MTTRTFGLLYVFKSRLTVTTTLLLAFSDTPASGSQPKNGTRGGGELLANDESASSGVDEPPGWACLHDDFLYSPVPHFFFEDVR